MRLREWLQEVGSRSLTHTGLGDVQAFTFGEDAYAIQMQAGQIYQDNDLDRLLGVIRDEFTVYNNEQTLRNGTLHMGPEITFPFVRGKPRMLVRPCVLPESAPLPDMDQVVASIESAITMFNLTGSFQPPMARNNL